MDRQISGQAIRKLRKKKLKLTQAQFAKILRVSRETIARWESGGQHPHAVFISAIESLRRNKLPKT